MTTTQKPTGQITKTERAHVRSLIKMHFATLRKEVFAEQERALARVDIKIAEYHARNREAASSFHTKVDKIVDQAQAKIAALVADSDELFGAQGRWRVTTQLHKPRAYRRDDDEVALRRAMLAKIRTSYVDARTTIDRTEATALRDLLLDALETDAAHAMLTALPEREQVFTVDFNAIEAGQ